MSEESQRNDPLPQASPEQDLVALIKKMQQQLIFLEKKIDILISQFQERPFEKRHFSKPFRPAEKSFDHGRRFEKRPGEENRGFGYKKKSYNNPRGSDFGQEQRFEKRHGDENRGFGQKKRPFFHKRRDKQ